MIQRTLVLVKPDGVQRALIGRVINRFENAGLKLVGMKMRHVDKGFATRHYTEDITKRRGEKVRQMLLNYITSGPVIAMVWEGVHAVDIVRKIGGTTEPKAALPGTIRGDFCHHSFSWCDSKEGAIKNIIHASGNPEEAEYEVNLWFSEDELHKWDRADKEHVY